MACCLHINFIDIRRSALKAMQKSYNVFPMDHSTYWPLKELVFLLGFDDFINKCTIKNENYSIRENIETKSDKLFSYLYFNGSLFFSLKEISKIFIKPVENQSYYNEHLIPPLYSAISIILYDFQNNKFYT
jgi:hypothetical protein